MNLTCRACKHRWYEKIDVNLSFRDWLDKLSAARCPECGSGDVVA